MSNPPAEIAEVAAAIELLVLDVDGVLTDGRLYIGPDGEMMKAFHVKDGLGMKLLGEQGVAVAVISAKRSAPLERRLEDVSAQLELDLDGHEGELLDEGHDPERLPRGLHRASLSARRGLSLVRILGHQGLRLLGVP